jgi:hypothetical protein
VCCVVLISLVIMFTVLTVLIIFHQLHRMEFFMCVYIKWACYLIFMHIQYSSNYVTFVNA